MRVIVPVLALALSTLAATAGAQQQQRQWKPEVRPFIGTVIPTGQLRDVIGSETQYGLQVAGEMRPWLHLVGTAGWTPAATRHPASDATLRVLMYDVGAEVSGTQPWEGAWKFHPFWGAGAGARTYLYQARELQDRTCLSGYLSTGIELQNGPVGLRAEGRDNLFCYRSPVRGEGSGTRNDLAFSLSVALHFR